MKFVTGKDIRKQLIGHYSSYLFVVLMIAGILGFCVVFCGSQLGWLHLFSIIGTIGLLADLIIFCIVLMKIFQMNRHRIFVRYGTAEDIAISINQALAQPRYVSKDKYASFGLLIADNLIVSGADYRSYLTLQEVRAAQILLCPQTRTVVVGNDPLISIAATMGTNYAAKKYQETHDIQHHDFLRLWDKEGKHYEYSIQRRDMEKVVDLLAEIAPHIVLKETSHL